MVSHLGLGKTLAIIVGLLAVLIFAMTARTEWTPLWSLGVGVVLMIGMVVLR